MRKSFRFSIFLFSTAVSLLWAGNVNYTFNYFSKSRAISEADVQALVEKNLSVDDNVYYKAKIDIASENRGSADYLVAYLFHKKTYKVDVYRLNVSNNKVTSVVKDYIPKDEEVSTEKCRACPDESVIGLFSTPMKDNPQFKYAQICVQDAYDFFVQKGIKAKILLGENETSLSNIKAWLSCPNLRIWGRIGHGTNGMIIVGNNGQLTSSTVSAMNLENKIMMWNSCDVHSSSMINAMKQADAYFFAAGDGVELMASMDGQTGSEPMFEEWIKQVVGDDAQMGDKIDELNPQYNQVGHYFGWTGRTPKQSGDYLWSSICGDNIKLSSPNGGEKFVVSTDMDIEWTTNIKDAIALKLIDNSGVVKSITSSATNGMFTWSIPSDIDNGDNYRVVAFSGDAADTSDDVFTIKQKPSISFEDLKNDEIQAVIERNKSNTAVASFTIKNSGMGPLAYSISTASGKTGLMINEIFTPKNEFFDGLELWNASPDDIDMDGWKVVWTDNTQTSDEYEFSSFTLKSGKTVVLTDDDGATNSNTFYMGLNVGWDYEGGTELSVAIIDADGNCVDFMKSSGSDAEPPADAEWSGDGVDLTDQRVYRKSSFDNDNAEDWAGASGESSVNQINNGQSIDDIMVPWMEISSKKGEISGRANTKEIGLTFNGEGLELGTYNDTLIIAHDDPDTKSPYRIPVVLEVKPGSAVLVSTISGIKNFDISFKNGIIAYQIPMRANGSKVSVNLYDSRGKLVETLVNGIKKSGFYSESMGSSISAGNYICRLVGSGFTKSIKVLNIK